MTTDARPACMRILLYGYYGCGNVGDELLLNAAMTGILRHWPHATFRVRNLGPVEVEPHLADRLELTDMEQVLATPDKGRFARVLAYLGLAWRAMRGCRVLVLGGGTLISGLAMRALVLLAIVVMFARIRGLAVVGIGLGAARLKRLPARLLSRLIVALASEFCVRDEASLKALGSPRQVRVTSDLVFSWWPETLEPPTVQTGEVIVVSLWSTEPAEGEKLVDQIAAALIHAARSGACIRFVVFHEMETSLAKVSDRAAIDLVRRKLAAAAVASEVVRPRATRASLAEAFQGARVHLGARFHAGVVATLFGVPSIGIALDPKITSLGAALGQPVFFPADVTQEALAAAIDASKANRETRDAIAQFRALSEGNFRWFALQSTSVGEARDMAGAIRR